MKRYEEIKENLKVGDKLKCIQLVSNDKEELGYDVYILEDNENQEELAEYYNEHNQDKNFKYIAVNYEVVDDGYENFYLEAI